MPSGSSAAASRSPTGFALSGRLVSNRQMRSAPKSHSPASDVVARRRAPWHRPRRRSRRPPRRRTRRRGSCGAAWPASMIALGRGGGDRDARGIVDRAGAQIPAVEMPADQDDARRGIAAGHFGDDVARFAASPIWRGVSTQLQPHRLAALQHALELLGVGQRQRGGGDRLHAVGQVGAAGVRVAVMIGADRADHDRRRALASPRSPGPTRRAAPNGRSYDPSCVARHRVADEGDLALQAAVGRGLQIGERREIDDLGRQPRGRRRARIAERGRASASAGRATRPRRSPRRAPRPAS